MALKSYAKQMKDSKLEDDAQRIRDRAVQRAGELLLEIKEARGANQNIRVRKDHKVATRKDAAVEAGLTPEQAKTAIKVARVEKKLADQMIEATPVASGASLAAELDPLVRAAQVISSLEALAGRMAAGLGD